MKILCYNDNCCDENGFDDVINHPDAIVIELDDNCDFEIHDLISKINDLPYTDLEKLFPMSNFKEVYWALIDNEFVDVID